MRKLAATMVLLLVVAVGALALSFRPARLPSPVLLAETSLPKATPPADMTLSALPTGAMHAQAALAYRGGSWSDKRDFSMTGILVHHPRGDLLVDTGFGRNVDQHFGSMPWLYRVTTSYTKGTPIADRLAAAGYDTKQLAGVVLTHAHWDHVSGLPDLPGVPVWVTAVERSFVESGDIRVALAHSFGALPFKTYEFDGGAYLGFPRSFDVWGDGSVVLVPAPGHTPGSIIAFIALPSGARYALLGDLVWQLEGIEIPAERPWLSRTISDVNAANVRENIERVAAIHARFPDLHLVPAHDSRAMGALPVFPAVAQ
jgi:glyoxylase-like metal-dependent hydrolase (beta-lactamase superfamily II)